MSPRIQSILVPIDFSVKNWAALDMAFEIAVHNEAAVTLLHVIEVFDEGDFDDDLDVKEFYVRVEDRLKRELETMGQRFGIVDIDVREQIRFGKRADEIRKYHDDHAIDLIIMSCNTRDFENRTSTIVTQINRCPILLIEQKVTTLRDESTRDAFAGLHHGQA